MMFIEIPGTDIYNITHELVKEAGWKRWFFVRIDFNAYEKLGSSGPMYLAWNECVRTYVDKASLGEPDITVCRLYSEEGLKDKYLLRFDAEKIDPVLMGRLCGDIRRV